MRPPFYLLQLPYRIPAATSKPSLPFPCRFYHQRILSDIEMQHAMFVNFLGTSSGGGPSESRNCSSLVVDALGDGSLWMVDCAEGTLRQFSFQPKLLLKASRVTKIFITHMHADHCMGIVPFLRQVLYPPLNADIPGLSEKPPKVEIYGPAGLRTFVRSILKMTFSRTADPYVVHELLAAEDEATPCEPREVRHTSELVGKDLRCSKDGLWRNITSAAGRFCEVVVDASPISHRDPCIGYVICESAYPSRKIVILGDTDDPSAIIPLATFPSPSLLIHEATDAHIPRTIDPSAKRTPEVVLQKALSRGHSIPAMAGAFAKLIGAEKLVLNHIGGRFPAPRSTHPRDIRFAVMSEIERQASEAWGIGRAAAAWDFMRVVVPAPDDAIQRRSREWLAREESISLQYANPNEGVVYHNRDQKHHNKRRR